MRHLVMAVLYVEAPSPDEATDAAMDAVRPIRAEGSTGVAVSFTPEAQADPRFWRDLEKFNIDPKDVEP